MANEKAIQLLLEDKFIEFNNYVDSINGEVDLSDAKLRARDLRGLRLKKANLKNAYLRLADLRGLDLSQADLDGASLRDAKVSGTLFPKNLDPQELALSLSHGIRLRPKA